MVQTALQQLLLKNQHMVQLLVLCLQHSFRVQSSSRCAATSTETSPAKDKAERLHWLFSEAG